jgi:hypothetical protein
VRTRRPEPNFFIVGAAKAGTTSLYEYLRQHPDVFMPEDKEPWFFCGIPDPAPASAKRFPTLESYLSLFENAGDCKAIGEASVSYLPSDTAAARIYERYPDARIIIVLRNPADRVYSWYNFLCQHGVEPGLSFEKALADQDRRIAVALEHRDTWYADELILYYHFGLISHHVERFVNQFPRNQIHVMLFDDLKANPLDATRGVFEFLGVDPSFTPEFGVHNPTWFPLSVRVQHMFLGRSRLHPFLPQRGRIRFFDRRVVPAVAHTNAALGKLRRRSFNPETRRKLINQYRDDIRRTEELTGVSLAAWLKTA